MKSEPCGVHEVICSLSLQKAKKINKSENITGLIHTDWEISVGLGSFLKIAEINY